MTEDNRDCVQIILQIVAVRQALTNCGKVMLKDHMDNCIHTAVAENDFKEIDHLFSALDIFIQ